MNKQTLFKCGTLAASSYTKVNEAESKLADAHAKNVQSTLTPEHQRKLARNLACLEEEEQFVNRDAHALVARGQRAHAKADDDTALIRINWTNIDALKRNSNLPETLLIALLSMLKRYRQSSWAHKQEHFLERGAIMLADPWEHAQTVTLCGTHGWFCQHPDYCPRCATRLRAKPASREYKHCFDKAAFWYAFTPSFEPNPSRAGLRFRAVRGQPMQRCNPFAGKRPASRLTIDDTEGEGNPVEACFRAVFAFAKFLGQCNGVGVLAHREVAWRFCPFSLNAHGHLLVCTPEPLNLQLAQVLFEIYVSLYAEEPEGRILYPDLCIKPLPTQKDITRWIFYMFKPMDFVTGYLRAVSVPGCDLERLNRALHQNVFQGGNAVLSVRGPRRYGILSCKHPKYIGGGSITAARNEDSARRKKEREKREELGLAPVSSERSIPQTPALFNMIQQLSNAKASPSISLEEGLDRCALGGTRKAGRAADTTQPPNNQSDFTSPVGKNAQ